MTENGNNAIEKQKNLSENNINSEAIATSY